MASEADVTGHYSHGALYGRLESALREDGADPARPTIEDLAPYDHFHGRGFEATVELAERLSVSRSGHVLDVGSGIGGPARYFAHRYGCRVTGIDLTEEFCGIARRLSAALDLGGLARFEQANALAMPFEEESFDAAYSMNVSMNIEDKGALHREIFRVLRAGGQLMLSEIARGPNPGQRFPTPWARDARSSFLATPEDTVESLRAAGFVDIETRDTKAESMAYGERSRELVDRGEKPPQRSVHLIHGPIAAEATGNTARGMADGCITPIEVSCRKPGARA